jgi:putative addiction module component (TIGR02574 family)
MLASGSLVRYPAFMSSEAKSVLHAALALPAHEREMLIDSLEESLDEGTAEEIEKAWIDEARRRLADIDRGEATPVSAESTLATMDAVIERARARRAG